jgi:hypothetical protein
MGAYDLSQRAAAAATKGALTPLSQEASAHIERVASRH